MTARGVTSTASPASATPAIYAGLDAGEAAGLEAIQERTGIRFRRPELLREAMTHASWNNERGQVSGPGHDNERLEYLGDAVLELVVGEYLFKRFPTYDEGQLTQLRASLVNTVSLAKLAEGLGLGDILLLGRGAAKTGARQLPSLLANSFEALMGAIFLDQGYRAVTRVFFGNVGDLADWSDENHKGRLQELAQERTGIPPAYRVVAAGGPGHRREYSADALVGGEVVGRGTGNTKQAAEQAAARAGVARLAARGKGAHRPAASSAAAGAARVAARGVAEEGPRVRRRVAEVAADRTAGRRRAPVAPPPALPSPSRRGLFGTLRAAAGALVSRAVPPTAAPPAATPRPTDATEASAPAAARRRGHRGGRGRGRQSADQSPAVKGGDPPRANRSGTTGGGRRPTGGAGGSGTPR
ncbi:MAG: ribonuclease III [Candidatus Dormibacteria bacterium]